jgi:hypothetical protein
LSYGAHCLKVKLSIADSAARLAFQEDRGRTAIRGLERATEHVAQKATAEITFQFQLHTSSWFCSEWRAICV